VHPRTLSTQTTTRRQLTHAITHSSRPDYRAAALLALELTNRTEPGDRMNPPPYAGPQGCCRTGHCLDVGPGSANHAGTRLGPIGWLVVGALLLGTSCATGPAVR
jgi:hypothetical protein